MQGNTGIRVRHKSAHLTIRMGSETMKECIYKSPLPEVIREHEA